MLLDLSGVTDSRTYFRSLRQRAADAGISCNRLARQAKIASTQLSRWMRGELDPRLSSILRLERALAHLITAKGATT